MIDLRSDTKTLPTPEMYEAIVNAKLGDDVAQEDPTVNELEEYSARLLGKEAGLLVTGGTQGNLISMYAQTRPGQEVICHEQAHIYHYERSGLAALCGLMPRILPGTHGAFDPENVERLYAKKDIHRQDIALLCLENTHNLCGGTCVAATQTADIAEVAHRHGTRVHIDGARLFNAQVALDVPAAALVAPVDSVTFCFSKGLGAPVGSMICGSADFIQRAREARKLFGGGMRQAGIIAAGALYALQHNVSRLADDHANARRIAETLAACPGITVDLTSVQTNIVYFSVNRPDLDAAKLVQKLKDEQVLCSTSYGDRIRMVTHLGISDSDTATVCQVIKELLS